MELVDSRRWLTQARLYPCANVFDAGWLAACREFGSAARARTRDQALILQIAGWAENRPDGSVEVFACGERAKLEELQAWLQEGPPLARVRSLEVAEAESQMLNGVTGFEIR